LLFVYSAQCAFTNESCNRSDGACAQHAPLAHAYQSPMYPPLSAQGSAAAHFYGCRTAQCTLSRESRDHLGHLGVVGGAKASHRVPPRLRIKALVAAARPASLVGSRRDVVEHGGVLVEQRVGKAEGRLARSDAEVVEESEDA
jgi:hypothetical protein